MTSADPSEVLSRAALWAVTLRARGLVDDAPASRLNETLAESRGERLDCKDDPLLVVMLCGPTAVGKSTLINALAGADISRRGLGATTGAAVLYVHEQDDPARLFEYSSALAAGGRQETALVRHRCDELLHKVLVDTPDIDSVLSRHEEITAGLVHAADLVLFVTSPEKYKAVRSARWVLERRQQRAIAFILNKWDQEALGLQRDRRHEVVEDFCQVLAGEGYPEALVFKVSALPQPSGDAGQADIENDLPALRAWLESGITQSTAAILHQRRLRAAWGRLAAAIEHVVPQPLSNHSLLPELFERLANSGATATHNVDIEASLLELIGLEENGWPSTPGLLGMWTRARHYLVATFVSWRMMFSRFNVATHLKRLAESSSQNPARADAFGSTTAAVLSAVAVQIADESAAARLLLGPVAALWVAETVRLEHQLALLPLDGVTAITAQTNRPSVRRWAGIASIYAVEGLIGLVLIVTAGRLGMAFATGSYAPKGLLTTAWELILVLLIIGHITATSVFPPLRQRVRRHVALHAKALVTAAVAKMQAALHEQVEAADRVVEEGGQLLRLIDRLVAALASGAGGEQEVDRLFGVEPQPLRPDGGTPQSLIPAMAESAAGTQRHPSFD